MPAAGVGATGHATGVVTEVAVEVVLAVTEEVGVAADAARKVAGGTSTGGGDVDVAGNGAEETPSEGAGRSAEAVGVQRVFHEVAAARAPAETMLGVGRIIAVGAVSAVPQ